MSTLMAGLNPEQRKAVITIKGPLLVLAGAGTGKTSVITHRIAHMLAKGIAPRSILAMTFTNKAAGEMKERIARLVRKRASSELTVGTFHSFCVKALRVFADQAGVRHNFAICDAADQLVAIKNAMRRLHIPETTMQPKLCLARVSLLKNRLITPDQFLASADNDLDELVGRAYRRYDQALHTSGLLDFDDLLLYMVRLLKDKKALAHFRKRYEYILVDEYQDTNGPQYEIVKRIGAKHKNVCVVGDDDQSIYGWRGADVSKILGFEKDFPNAIVVRLETNYRSTTEIIEGANAVIRNNPSRHEKSLRSATGSGEPIAVMRADDEEIEAEYVVNDILRHVREDKARLGEFAILFRTQVQPRLFEMRLRHERIPYVLVGGMSFFDRKEVRDVLAYLRLIANPTDELSLLRVINTPPRGIGRTTVEKALALAAKNSLPLAQVFATGREFPELKTAPVVAANEFLASLEGLRTSIQPDGVVHGDGSKPGAGRGLVDLIKALVRDVDYGEEIKRCYPDEKARATRWNALNEILNMAEIHVRGTKDATLEGFLEDLTLNATEEKDDKDAGNDDTVTLMTLHSAKGLEFEQVYLVGLEEGLLPHFRSVQDDAVEEERRLAYVGITRAKRRLTVTFTRSRAKYGRRVATVPSRFLYEMRGETPPQEQIDAVHEQSAGKPSDKCKACATSRARKKGKRSTKKSSGKRKRVKRTTP